MTDEQIIDDILAREGGFTDHPADCGGPTNRGITLREFEAWRGAPTTVEDLKTLTEAEARAIYRETYIQDSGLWQVADGPLRALLVDCAVNHGPRRAVQWLQRALGVKQDGIFGPRTLAALQGAASNRRLYLSVCADRVRAYGRLITNSPSQAVFAAGWLNRAADFIEEAAA